LLRNNNTSDFEELADLLTTFWFSKHKKLKHEDDVQICKYIDDLIVVGKEESVNIVYNRAQLVINMLLGPKSINQEKLTPPSTDTTILVGLQFHNRRHHTLTEGKIKNNQYVLTRGQIVGLVGGKSVLKNLFIHLLIHI